MIFFATIKPYDNQYSWNQVLKYMKRYTVLQSLYATHKLFRLWSKL